MEDVRYPVGRFAHEGPVSVAQRQAWIEEVAQAPGHLRRAVERLDSARLDAPYREGGWTIRQVVHHLPDSHMNSYVRMRLALTEDEPTIKPYAEKLWAELPDARSAVPEVSLALLDALHQRWVLLLRAMKPEDWRRTFRHPERGVVPLDVNLGLYAWHGRHHVAQITGLRRRMGW
jgi:uncharacterized damage-inducible protein DinB